jgi:hypothetical protein
VVVPLKHPLNTLSTTSICGKLKTREELISGSYSREEDYSSNEVSGKRKQN